MASLIRNYAARVASKVPARRTSLALISSAALAGAALPALGLLAGTASAASKICTLPVSGVVTCVFGADGSPLNWAVPAGITTLNVTADGADGGNATGSVLVGHGGEGGEMRATLTNIPSGTTLVVFPGGKGVTSGNGGVNLGPGLTGTSSGGAAGSGTLSNGGSGGGASTVSFLGSGTQFSNVLVAAGGGGGGSTYSNDGGNGGTAAHPNGTGGHGVSPGGGATTTAGGGGGTSGTCSHNGASGSALTGGAGGGGSIFCANGGGGGGSGYYGGGGGGGGLVPASSGGGGSSFPATATTVRGITVTPDVADNSLWAAGDGQVTISYTMIPTTTKVNCLPNPSIVGQNVTCTATITPGSPTGTVQFQDGASTIGGCAAVPVTTGSAACSTSGLTAGPHTITATYTPTAGSGWEGSFNTTNQVVKIATTTTLQSSLNPSTYGDSVTLTATVSPTDGGGTVDFKNGGNNIAGCTGKSLTLVSGHWLATCTRTTLPIGSNPLTAVYSGDAQYAGSTSNTVNQVVKTPTATTLYSSRNPSTYGQSVTLTAVVVSPGGGGVGAGTVDFKNGGNNIAGCTGKSLTLVSGHYQATCTTSTLPVGSNPLTAVYSGDAQYGGSTSRPVNQVVNPLPTALRVWLVVHADGTYTVFAQLTSSGTGVSGQAIHFIAGRSGPALCTAGTDSSGIAQCYLNRTETAELLRYWGAFTASYGGGIYAAASAFYPGIFWWL